MARTLLVLGALVALAGCSGSEDARAPGGVTAGEQRALGDAAAMLDERPSDEPSLAPSDD